MIDFFLQAVHNFRMKESGNLQHIVHTLAPVWDSRSRVLILGTMPSPKSRAYGFYYMHPQNRFWPVLAAVFDEKLLYTYGSNPEKACLERRELVLHHGLALWDVLASCDIHGADDASIRNPAPNNLLQIIRGSEIARIFTTGQTAYTLYTKMCEPVTHIRADCLPSTSPANRGRWPLEKLIEAYRILR